MEASFNVFYLLQLFITLKGTETDKKWLMYDCVKVSYYTETLMPSDTVAIVSLSVSVSVSVSVSFPVSVNAPLDI